MDNKQYSKDYSRGFSDGVKNFFDMLCIEIEQHSYETGFDYLATVEAIKEVYGRLEENNDK